MNRNTSSVLGLGVRSPKLRDEIDPSAFPQVERPKIAQSWDAEEGLSLVFDDLAEALHQCELNAVRALKNLGELPPEDKSLLEWGRELGNDDDLRKGLAARRVLALELAKLLLAEGKFLMALIYVLDVIEYSPTAIAGSGAASYLHSFTATHRTIQIPDPELLEIDRKAKALQESLYLDRHGALKKAAKAKGYEIAGGTIARKVNQALKRRGSPKREK